MTIEFKGDGSYEIDIDNASDTVVTDNKRAVAGEWILPNPEYGLVYRPPPPKAVITIGDYLHIESQRRFNWFQRKMMALFFGWEVKNTEEEGDATE